MKIRLSYYLAGICFLWMSCTQTTTLDQPEQQQIPLNFSVSSEAHEPAVGEFGDTTNAISQAPTGLTKSYILTTTNLTSFGVVSSYTGTGNFNTNTSSGSLPNSMYNVDVSRSSSSNPWDYSPDYFWPASTSNKLSFFAYAPHSSDCGGAVSISSQSTRGVPRLYYTVPSDPTSHIDLLTATPRLNLTRTTGTVSLAMKHVMAKFAFYVKKWNTSDPIYITNLQITGLKGSGNIAMSADSTWKVTGSNTASYVLGSSNLISNALTSSYQMVNLDNSTLFVLPQVLVSRQAYITFTAVRYYWGFYEVSQDFSTDLSTLMSNKTISLGGNYRIQLNLRNGSI